MSPCSSDYILVMGTVGPADLWRIVSEDFRVLRAPDRFRRAPSTRPHDCPLTEMAVWISYPPMDALSSGSLGYETGSYELTVNGPNGEAVIEKGRYIELLRRDPNGKWYSTHGIWNPAPEWGRSYCSRHA